MLKPINEFPKDKKIASIHSVAITEDGLVIMAWDKNEKGLTTIGGRIENNEDIHTALDRETVEEAGIILESVRIPFACWYWENTDIYTVFVVARVSKYVPLPDGFETTGRVVMNFETARQVVTRLEGNGLRTDVLKLAEEAYLKGATTDLGNKKLLYRLKDNQENRFLYPNLMNDRFRIIGNHVLIKDNYEDELIQIESLGPAYSGGHIYVSRNDIQKLKNSVG
ncbi:NUDIX domain-containing protein [Paenibacillus dokdonensis]|uniref:NUDIX domain-containing protein n=1 Tax=Paenibacillus dokdonensis TaxID=2567944 RepID=UPI0010A92773|nr:NUDIX domain-containing protein [Paenibacillus dokdonensis]